MTGPRPPARPLPLPTRDGVGPSCVALPAGPWPTIAACLAQRFPAISPAVWAARMAAGEVVDEHGVPVTPERHHQPRLRLYYYRALEAEARIPFDEQLLFQDEHLVVADKPHFLPVTPSGRYLQETLLVRLKRRLGLPDLVPLHRLDRETAGVVLFSAQPATRGLYQRLFAERRMHKLYECIAPWRSELAWPLRYCSRLVDDEHFMRVREAPGEANAETELDPIEVQGGWARYRLAPTTGRRHQLRVHCAALGLPILHDRIYPALLPADSDDLARPLQLLAKRIAFTDPLSGAARHFESPRHLLLAEVLQAGPPSLTLAPPPGPTGEPSHAR
ncbi:MAG TPA: pseudouridine synthase [Ideonella sp.]|nr:pseudouridine synthase [Ideonella sp.]